MLPQLFAVTCTLTLVGQVRGQSVEVSTPQGTVRGVRLTVADDSYVDTFFNIPYARPPVGYLRFRAPQKPESWQGVRDASQFGPQCPQILYTGINYPSYPNSEDCLVLNIYSPKPAGGAAALPVMVWIHGGAYYLGTGMYYNATTLAAKGVVVVTISYRLGALGFLSTEDAASPGNYGLMDQIRALEWVRDSISAFNGDPNDVTIFGQSAGGGSVSLLVLSRSAKGLFQKAIMESGTSLCPWAMGYPNLNPKPRDMARKLARHVGCSTDDSVRMVACLKTKDAMLITNVSDTLLDTDSDIAFRPVPETTFGQFGLFAASPLAILENGWFSNVTTIRGFNKDELGQGVRDEDDDGITVDEFKNFTHDFMMPYTTPSTKSENWDRIMSLLLDAYVTKPGLIDPKQLRAAFIQMLTDFSFAAGTVQELQLASRMASRPQYAYRFSYRSANRLGPAWQGVTHGAEVMYVFGAPFGQENAALVSRWTDEDRKMSDAMMTAWTNFAKYGDPTPTAVDGVKWLPWTQDNPYFAEINDTPQLLTSLVTPQISLWIDTVFGLMKGTQGVVGK